MPKSNNSENDPRLVKLARFINDMWPQLIVLLATLYSGVIGISLSAPLPETKQPQTAYKVVGINTSPRAGQTAQVGNTQLNSTETLPPSPITPAQEFYKRSSWLVTTWMGWLYLVLVGGQVIGTVVTWQREGNYRLAKTTISNLEEELSRVRAGQSTMLNHYLSVVSYTLNLGDTERVSVYKHDGRAFLILGRYSLGPNYNKNGRTAYPENEGCIGRAWENGSDYLPDLPDPMKDTDAYIQANCTLNMSEETARNLTMKSRCYSAFAIKNPSGLRRVAVIVFESIKPNGIDHIRVQDFLAVQQERQLSLFLEELRGDGPSPSEASGEGL